KRSNLAEGIHHKADRIRAPRSVGGQARNLEIGLVTEPESPEAVALPARRLPRGRVAMNSLCEAFPAVSDGEHALRPIQSTAEPLDRSGDRIANRSSTSALSAVHSRTRREGAQGRSS
ncbi:hypothetical protein Dimus_037649, partial [Dionaea muscipula]